MTYQKGKDLKQKGDCLTYCFIKKIELTSGFIEEGNDFFFTPTLKKPAGFDTW
jgi:hypothetical protein